MLYGLFLLFLFFYNQEIILPCMSKEMESNVRHLIKNVISLKVIIVAACFLYTDVTLNRSIKLNIST